MSPIRGQLSCTTDGKNVSKVVLWSSRKVMRHAVSHWLAWFDLAKKKHVRNLRECITPEFLNKKLHNGRHACVNYA